MCVTFVCAVLFDNVKMCCFSSIRQLIGLIKMNTIGSKGAGRDGGHRE